MRSRILDQLPKAVQDDLARLGLAIREGRTAKGMTQGELARRLQISPTTVRAAESGDPSIAAGILIAIFWVLGVGPFTNVVTPYRQQWAETLSRRQRVRRRGLDEF